MRTKASGPLALSIQSQEVAEGGDVAIIAGSLPCEVCRFVKKGIGIHHL